MDRGAYRASGTSHSDDSSSFISNLLLLFSSKPWTAVGAIVMVLCAITFIALSIQAYRRWSDYRRLTKEMDDYDNGLKASKKRDKKKHKKSNGSKRD